MAACGSLIACSRAASAGKDVCKVSGGHSMSQWEDFAITGLILSCAPFFFACLCWHVCRGICKRASGYARPALLGYESFCNGSC